MTNTMEYKGYEATIEYSAEDALLCGRVLGIRDVISFHGTSVDELATNFHSAVDDYLDACEQDGQAPNKPFSGKLSLRMEAGTHRAAALAAARENVSLNQWINRLIVASARRSVDAPAAS